MRYAFIQELTKLAAKNKNIILLTADLGFTVFEEFAKMGVLKVALSGGEPLIRNDIEKILLLTTKYPFATILLTNGTLLTHTIVKTIKKSEISLITVSLEGSTPVLHDKIRMSINSFKDVLKGVALLKEEKIPFAIGTTLNSLNIKDIFNIIKLANKLGAELFAIQVLCPTGRVEENLGIIPSRKDYENFFLKLTDLKIQGKLPVKVKLNVTNEAPVFWEYYYPLANNDRINDLFKVWGSDFNTDTQDQITCVAGRKVCSIASNGDVFPCEMFLSKQSLVAGNIRKQKFKQIWKNSLILKKFRNLTKDKLTGSCKKCHYKWCGGGCLAAGDNHCFYAQ